MTSTFVVCVTFLACVSAVFCARFSTAPNHFGQLYFTKGSPRGLFVDESGDLLFVSRLTKTIIAITETVVPNRTISLLESELINAGSSGIALNHAVVHHQGYLYASSETTVYRWQYVAGSREISSRVRAQAIINKIPAGGHITRTLAFEGQTMMLYISIGSNANIDPDSERARIRRFNLSNISVFPIDFAKGEIYADGLRNEVGLAFDASGILWGVENSGDNLVRDDLGGDIHNTNPAEELNRFDGPIGTNYGYPFCFSTDVLKNHSSLTQFAWPDFLNDGVHTDAWCQNVKNNHAPHLAIPAHTAPLGIVFYDGQGCDTAPGSFPCDMIGDAFVALHGSWNSNVKVGYKVIRIPFTKSEPFLPTGQMMDIIYEPNLTTCNKDCFRPVNAVFNHNGHLLVSADASNEIFKVTYGVPPPAIKKVSRKRNRKV